jgi:Flp pilus assembly protein TadG
MASKQSGASAIEFALILPLVLLLFDAVIEFSMLMYDQAIITHASREAVRAGVVVKNPKLSNTAIAALAQNQANAYLISFGNSDTLLVTVNQSSDSAFQTPLSVTMNYTYTSLLGGSFLASILQPITLSATSTALNE